VGKASESPRVTNAEKGCLNPVVRENELNRRLGRIGESGGGKKTIFRKSPYWGPPNTLKIGKKRHIASK